MYEYRHNFGAAFPHEVWEKFGGEWKLVGSFLWESDAMRYRDKNQRLADLAQ